MGPWRPRNRVVPPTAISPFGCIELRGMARKVDITMLQNDHKSILQKMDELPNTVAREVQIATEMICKSRTPEVLSPSERIVTYDSV